MGFQVVRLEASNAKLRGDKKEQRKSRTHSLEADKSLDREALLIHMKELQAELSDLHHDRDDLHERYKKLKKVCTHGLWLLL